MGEGCSWVRMELESKGAAHVTYTYECIPSHICIGDGANAFCLMSKSFPIAVLVRLSPGERARLLARRQRSDDKASDESSF
ncbi:unnamed protein product [Ceratitis capitata]|uniref:(Mediterranean fruit fly) hypothetical protein n=1 Tax=Ceratitis capitata TaxID=7213 RepID=A0A811UGP1_CERCA|nr:unnamed protein product [Ceratitis capitata]